MAKIKSGTQTTSAAQISRSIQSQSTNASTKAQAQAPVAAPVDQLASQVAQNQKPAASSPLTATLMAGLSDLAESYYGTKQAAAAPQLQMMSSEKELDSQVSPEIRELKAQRLARQTGIPANTSKEIVDLAAYILSF